LWARLSIFPGSFDLDAVEETCGFTALPRERIVDLLDRLVAKSIVMTERSGERVRYRQLMTVREYGAEVLGASGETQTLKRRQRDYYLRKAAAMVENWCGPGQAAAVADMKEDHANLLSALEWSTNAAEEVGAAAEMASLLRYHWVAGGYLSEGRRWLDLILRSPTMSNNQRGQALWVGAWVALMQGDGHVAANMLAECEDIAEALPDRKLLAHAIQWRGLHEFVSGNIVTAIDLYQRSIEIHTDVGDTSSVLTALFQLAISHAYNSDVDTALRTCDRAIDISERHGEQWNRSYALWITGLCQWLRGEPDAARAAATRALALEREFKDSICTALTIELLSWIAVSAQDFRTAAALAAAASAVWEGLGTDVEAFGPHLHQDSTHSATIVREALGEKAIANLTRRNASLTLDAAVAMALGSDRTASDKSAAKSPLTKRENQIAELVAQGLSNRAIAESLVLSPRTVDGHVEHILTKLEFSSRSQIASWVGSRKAQGVNRS
jgi:DNA-binding CsgD family transcriptional regulator